MADEPKQPDAAAPDTAPVDANGTTEAPNSDALSKPTDADSTDSMSGEGGEKKDLPPKKLNPIKKITRRVNIYLMLFALIFVIGLGVVAYAYLSSKKTPPPVSVVNQNLTESQLKQLASSNATVGGSGQTLTVQGNAVFSGNVLVRQNLNVAGTIQMGGPLTLADLNISNSANLAATQINSLQVSGASTFQSLITAQNGLVVGGTSSFTGTLSVGAITVSKLIMSNNGLLTVPNHVSFTGSSPRITAQSVGGGSASVAGSDTSGTVTINTGGGGSSGCMVTLAFSQSFASTPHVIISPINAAAGGIEFYATRNTSSFSICSAIGAAANQSFAFSYFITD